ncbi:hypothetical protein ACLOJK_004278, partial [Asimina triloba]
MRYRQDDQGIWIYKDDIQGIPSQTSHNPFHPSSSPTDANVEDFLVDPKTNVAGTGLRSGQPSGHDDVETTVPSTSTPPLSPGGDPFSTPSTLTSPFTMFTSFMPSSSQCPNVT